MNAINDLINPEKEILILGFGKEGQSTYRFLRKQYPAIQLKIADRNKAVADNPLIAGDKHLTLICGEDYLSSLNNASMVIKTPGISFQDIGSYNPLIFTSQADIFLNIFSDQIIGVTGTKGKSTTSGLIHHIVSQHTTNCLLAGNIGIPFFDLYDRIDENTLIVCELSSHQLEYIRSSPRVAVMLNLYQEHLDHYSDFEAYGNAKYNICVHQKHDDSFIFFDDDIEIRKLAHEYPPRAHQVKYSLNELEGIQCFISEDWLVFRQGAVSEKILKVSEQVKLRGKHNLLNIMAAVCACRVSGIPHDSIARGVSSFKPLEHRLEFVGTKNGIDFYNDSIATIPEASIAAIKAIDNTETLILGGFDRGIDYSEFASFLASSELSNFIFMGKAGLRIMNLLESKIKSGKNIFYVDSLDVAVDIAFKTTTAGKACLLSPAAASYDMFKDFTERGTLFKQLILKRVS